ncbi:predicted protein [Nematostella vectensis]|uniref:REJ domain-containing protein n=1 Tax=Nematostella vectensis TaxID=45351 RepID=A7T556_NEMVE|nr:predicted protein [Nematostella vectensis]|eukprot:XP_001621006.1 hypothetical protein NEMVEDRAFT_v1g222464 [Nematostella vectensis]
MWVNFTVTVMEVNIGVQLTNDGPTKWTTQTRLDVSLVQIGYNSCCLVDITNNTYFLFKDSVETACDPVWTNLTSDVTVFSQRRDTNSSWEFQFWQVHYYLSKVTCKNTVSVVSDWKYVIVLAHACKFPKLSIPAISASCKVARVFPKSYKINIASKNSIDCFDSRTTTFAWTLMTSETPDNISSFRYYALPDGTVSDRATMEIPAGALSYGYYHACLNVSLNLWLVDSAICACIKIAPSPLQCFVLGGNGWEHPVNKSTILNGALSYDPDVDPSLFTQNFTLQFYCKTEAENYTFPDDGDDEAVAAGSSGGCFGKGPGRLPSNTTQITIPPGTLETNTTYVFRYYCAKGQSRGHFDVRLHAVETDRPHCAIM